MGGLVVVCREYLVQVHLLVRSTYLDVQRHDMLVRIHTCLLTSYKLRRTTRCASLRWDRRHSAWRPAPAMRRRDERQGRPGGLFSGLGACSGACADESGRASEVLPPFIMMTGNTHSFNLGVFVLWSFAPRHHARAPSELTDACRRRRRRCRRPLHRRGRVKLTLLFSCRDGKQQKSGIKLFTEAGVPERAGVGWVVVVPRGEVSI